MDINREEYLTRMSSMKEDNFTRKILKPLFYAMNHDSVEFHGGPGELGRDMIAYRQILPRKTPHITYVQTKRLGGSTISKESKKFFEIILQLQQASKTGVIANNGIRILPDSVYLASPDLIPQRMRTELEAAMSQGALLIEWYDGPQILEDILAYKPDLLSQFTCFEESLSFNPTLVLANPDLLKALRLNTPPELDKYYSDLSFFVGYADSNKLIHANCISKSNNLELSKSEWQRIKSLSLMIEEGHDLKISDDTFAEVESNYLKELMLFDSRENQSAIKLCETLAQEISDIAEQIELTQATLTGLIKNYGDSGWIDESLEYEQPLDTTLAEIEVSINTGDIEDLSKSLALRQASKNTEQKKRNDSTGEYLEKLIECIKSREQKSSRLEEVNAEILTPPKYKLTINTNSIIETIERYKDQYFKTVNKINSCSIDQNEMQNFLDETQNALSFLALIYDDKSPLSQVLEFDLTKGQHEKDRVSISPHDIFESGIDSAIYGGAGVGKTTTLISYATSLSHRDDTLVIYTPLNKIVEDIKKFTLDEQSKNKFVQNLVSNLILLSNGIALTEEALDSLSTLNNQRSVLILDGLDEIYSVIPEIVDSLKQFKEKYPSVQLIVSSRDCVSYIREIKFLGITLLPFTEQQLKSFIAVWLDDEILERNLINSIFDRALYECMKTPLLATIVCSLVSQGVKVPETESEVYSERLNLLTGDYDGFKNIVRQVNPRDRLQLCARKIALGMHNAGVRSWSIDKMKACLNVQLGGLYSDKLLTSFLNELIDPCNVLIIDQWSQKYSFGHFRFQEHLVAKEILHNREIDLVRVVTNDWWRGAISIYAQQNTMNYIFDKVLDTYGNISCARETLLAVIDSSPNAVRQGMQDLYDKYIDIEHYEVDDLI